jgi:hypothetical protein
MPQRFQCGLLHTYPTANQGQFFVRWLFEWLTRVVGWAVVDKYVGAPKWDNVVASGSTCTSTTTRRLEITSGSYVISAADEGSFLTITGFGSPYQTRDGIYRLRRFIGAVGSVYTVELDIDFGVHSDGIPVGHSGLTWRLWAGTTAYCPDTTSYWAVLKGKGRTGAGLATGTGTGDTLAASGGTVTLTNAAANNQASDVGKVITIAGATTSAHNGTWTIASRISATQITWANGAGGLPASESYSGTWDISYDYHVVLEAQTTTNAGMPNIRISPFAAWDPVTHTWKTGDLRYTSTKAPPGAPAGSRIVIYAEADDEHFFVATRMLSPLGTTSQYAYWMTVAAGELNPLYPTLDPRPCYLWYGCDGGAAGYEAQDRGCAPLFGYGGGNTFRDQFRALSFDDITTLVYYALLPSVTPTADGQNPLQGQRRKVSGLTGNSLYRIPVLLESRTTGHMEIRGFLRHQWAVNSSIPTFYQQGASGEFVSPLHGLLISWNNSRNALSETGHNYSVG